MSQPSAEYISLVVDLAATPDGTWRLAVETPTGKLELPLRPATLVIRLWRVPNSSVLRGTVVYNQTPTTAPFQTNTQMQQLVSEWLEIDSASNHQP